VPPEEIKNSSFLIDPSEVFSGAGALQDVSRYLQRLPGVVLGTNDFRNDIVVRGGSPLENLFIVDNVEIPNINTFANFTSAGGTVGMLDAALLSDVTFLTGGYPAPYINRVSSVLQIAQREGNREEFAGRATVGFAGAGGILEGPLGDGRGSWLVSVRRSFLDLVTDDIGFGGVPVLYTVNAKAVYDVTPLDRVWAVNVTGVDRIRLGLSEDSDLTEQISNFDVRYEGWRSATGFNWQRIFGTGGVGLLGVSRSTAKVSTTVKDLLQNGVPPPDLSVDEVIAAGPIVFRDDSRETETTVKYDLTLYVPMVGKIQVGGSAKVFQLDYDTAAPLGNDSPYSLEPAVNPFTLQRQFTAYQTGAYGQATRSLTERLNLTLGARFDHYQVIGEARVSPRAGASFALTDRLSWRGSYGRYYQQPFFPFLAAFPQNADLDPIRADHLVTGLTWQPDGLTRASVEVYRKTYRDYPVSTTFPTLSLANIGDTFNVRDVLFPMASVGRGRAEGVEFLVERKPGGRWYGQGNVAVSRARHAGLDDVLRPGSFDSPVVVNLDAGVQVSPAWQVSGRFAYLSGRPYTPYDEAASVAAGRGIYDLDEVNGRRLDGYARLDVRAERVFTVSGRPLLVFIGIQNVTNRRNVAGFSWNRRTGEIVVQDQLGIFPILGLEWRF
jgi:outer membrane receptor protein involved in Fe transport